MSDDNYSREPYLYNSLSGSGSSYSGQSSSLRPDGAPVGYGGSYSANRYDLKNDHPLARFVDAEVENFTAPEFVIDGVITAGTVLLAGGWGAGKTTQLIPLMTRAAHLCKSDDPLKPTLRRRVIYITEDVDQVRHIIKSMRSSGEFDGISQEQFRDWFKVVEAVRMTPDDIVKVAQTYEGLAYDNDNPETKVNFTAQAVVVFDTRSAVIDLRDENDNTEAGRVISTFRQGMPHNPKIIVGHLAKAMKRADTKDLSGRGAGAWEADVQQVLYLANDEAAGVRWLDVASPKHRFVSEIDGVEFHSVKTEIQGKNPIGQDVTILARHGVPSLVKLGGREEQKQEREAEAKNAAEQSRRDDILTFCRNENGLGKGVNRARIKESVKGRGESVGDLINELIGEHWILEMEIPLGEAANNRQQHYLYALSAEERDLFIKAQVAPDAARVVPAAYKKAIPSVPKKAADKAKKGEKKDG